MALVQDPNFWKRFSTAVHLDEEMKQINSSNSSGSRSSSNNSEPWLDRQKKKKSRRALVCWVFWLLLAAVVTAILVTIFMLKANGAIGQNGAIGEKTVDKPAIPGEDLNQGSYVIGGNGP